VLSALICLRARFVWSELLRFGWSFRVDPANRVCATVHFSIRITSGMSGTTIRTVYPIQNRLMRCPSNLGHDRQKPARSSRASPPNTVSD